MAKESQPSLTVTKLDAACRQIETAISLWFQDGDEVSIHTLTAAGHHVLHDLAKSTGGKSPVIFNLERIPTERRTEYKRLILNAENFFKHAERNPDPEATVTFSPEFIEAYIIDAIELFRHLDGKMTDLMIAFRFRFILNHAGVARIENTPMLNEPLSIQLKALPKLKFLEEYNKLRARFGNK